MKNILIILSIVFLCSATGAAQTIDKETFGKLVDYVNCKYTAACIESYRDSSKFRSDYKYYQTGIKDQLIACTPPKSLSYSELYGLLMEGNHWTITCNNLTVIINKRKNKFQENISTEEAITILTTLDSVLIQEERVPQDTIEHVKAELNKYIDSLSASEILTVSTSSRQQQIYDSLSIVKIVRETIKNDSIYRVEFRKILIAGITSNPLLWLICIVFVSLLILIFILLWRRSSSKRIEKVIKPLLLELKFELEKKSGQQEVKSSKFPDNHVTKENNNKGASRQEEIKHSEQSTDLGLQEKEITSIEEIRSHDESREIKHPEQNTDSGLQEITSIEEIRNHDESNNIKTEQPEQITDNKGSTKYVKVYQGKVFAQLLDSQEDCDFKIFDIRGNTANFTFCGDKNKALKKQYIFENICDIIEIRSTTPKDIINVENGTVMFKDGHWEVTIPAKIKFI